MAPKPPGGGLGGPIPGMVPVPGGIPIPGAVPPVPGIPTPGSIPIAPPSGVPTPGSVLPTLDATSEPINSTTAATEAKPLTV